MSRPLYLTREEEAALRGDLGEALRVAMKLIVRVGEALGAERLVKIIHAHASGISYDNIGEPGLRFIERLAALGGRVAVYSTYNPAGISIGIDSPLNIDSVLVEKQLRLIKSLESMGFVRSATCIPYEMRPPRLGEHLAWGESSAVAVANTVYGARTNREGGPLALAAALTGRTYYWGLHLEENRQPNALVKAVLPSQEEPWPGLLGYILGKQLPGMIPYLDADVAGLRAAMALCAAAAAAGNTAMCIVRGVSPEDQGPPPEPEERIEISQAELKMARDEVENADIEEADLFFTGCPHHRLESLVEKVVRLVERHGIPRRPVYVSVPGYEAPRVRSLAARLARWNIYILPGTCLVVSRLQGLASVVVTDSVKTAFYLPRRHGVRVALASLEEFIAVHSRGRS